MEILGTLQWNKRTPNSPLSIARGNVVMNCSMLCMTFVINDCVCRSASIFWGLSSQVSRRGASWTTSSCPKHAINSVTKVSCWSWFKCRINRGTSLLPLAGTSKETKGWGVLPGRYHQVIFRVGEGTYLVSNGNKSLVSLKSSRTRLV